MTKLVSELSVGVQNRLVLSSQLMDNLFPVEGPANVSAYSLVGFAAHLFLL